MQVKEIKLILSVSNYLLTIPSLASKYSDLEYCLLNPGLFQQFGVAVGKVRATVLMRRSQNWEPSFNSRYSTPKHRLLPISS